uniref:K Homology domain-containing protein n=1 Tax=Plectus sambesii TaxID=2011161 RepID=A0A914XKF7_9BILA
MSVPIFKDFHKHIIGKGGANVRKIREETTTRIDLPGEGSGEDKILVTGKKANVEKAVAQLTQIQNELASIVTLDLTIPAKIHSRLLGGGRRLVQDIQDECGGVQIRFPPEKSNSDKVTIRGPKDDAARAQKLLMDLANDRELSSFEDSVTAKAEFHRFLIGKGGSKIKKVRESCPDVRILFPRESDKDQETIHLIGRKEEVAQIKKHLEELILHLNEIVEVTTDVPAKWHKHFVARGANVLREIQDQNGGVSISFPRQNAQDTKVSIKGSKDCVEGAKQRIAEIVADLEAQITIKADIPAEYHRTLLGNRGQKVQDICAKYNVQIKFPDRETREAGGNHEEASGDGPSVLNTVSISGRLENCESARTALQACIPITEVAEVPFEFHGNLIGRSGETVRALMQNYDVSISIPPADQQLNEIKISGQAESVKDAIAEIGRRVDEFKLGAKDRELRMFQLTVQVPPEYHQRLIGPRGQKINQMRAKHDVQISIPKQAEGEEPNENVVITGYEENAHKCKAEIEEMVNELKNLFVQEITLDARIHPRLIGAKGRSIRKVMDDYHVDIRFPRSTDPDPNLVTVTGKDEDSVYNCIDHLRELEEEFSQDIGGGSYMSHRTEEPEVAQKQAPLQMVNAPWQVPDTNNMSDFPAMGAGAVGAPSGANGVWGGQRRF